MVLAGVGAATAVGVLLAVAISLTRPASALQRMAENIRQAKSLKAAMIAEHWHVPEPGKPAVVSKQSGTAYWLATKQPYAVFVIDHKAETIARQGVASQAAGLELMERLGRFSGPRGRRPGHQANQRQGGAASKLNTENCLRKTPRGRQPQSRLRSGPMPRPACRSSSNSP